MDTTQKVRFQVEKADPNVIFSNTTTSSEKQQSITSNSNGKNNFSIELNFEMKHMSFVLKNKKWNFLLLSFSVILNVNQSSLFYVILS
jgi:hypothetical protein